jgi:hypothetical protein
LVFAGFHAPAFSTAFFGLASCGSICLKTSHDVWPEANGYGSIQMFVDDNRATRQGVPETGLAQLPRSVCDRDGIVFAHHSFRLNREDPVQVRSAGTAKSRSFLFSRLRKLLVEPGDVAGPQKRVGRFHGRDLCQTKFLR